MDVESMEGQQMACPPPRLRSNTPDLSPWQGKGASVAGVRGTPQRTDTVTTGTAFCV